MTRESMVRESLLHRFASARDRVSIVGEMVQETQRAGRVWLSSAIVWPTIADLFGPILVPELICPNLFAGIP